MAVGEWDQRELCPDGGCVGVIGPDGTCKVCGRAAQNWGDERKRGLIDPPDEDGEGEDAAGEDAVAEHAAAKDADLGADNAGDAGDEGEAGEAGEAARPLVASSSPGDWGSRQLCPDGACIGVIGLDGTCKVCGRAASGILQATTVVPAVVLATEPTSTDPPGDPPGDPAITDAVTAGDPDSTKRPRCSDAACPGVSGPDGHCEVCGKVVI